MAIKQYPQAPYFDDFDEAKNYLRMLFRPGHAVQARELTQLQTVLQNQIGRFGEHMFVDGSRVAGGNPTFNKRYDYVKVESTYLTNNVDNYYDEFIGTTITGQTTGVKAIVLEALPTADGDPITLYVKYIESGTDNTTKLFAPEEVIRSDNPVRETKVKPLTDTPTGFGSSYSVGAGVFYVNSSFVYTSEQSIILEKYSNSPSANIVFRVDEKVVTAADDPALNDNALGSPNEAAPGAHRYSMTLTLEKQSADFDERDVDNYVRQALIVDGVLQVEAKSTEYNEILKLLETRTYEESGNYTVNPFRISIKEHISDDTKLTAVLEPSVAYVRGHRIETISPKFIDIDKSQSATDIETFVDSTSYVSYGNYVTVTSVSGLPDINTFSVMNILNASDTIIGTARARNLEAIGGNQYRLYLFDIVLNAGVNRNTIAKFNQTTISPNFSANMVTTGLIEDAGRNTAIFPLPYTAAKSISSITLRTKQKFSTTVSGGSASFLTSGSDELFVDIDDIVVVSVAGVIITSYTPTLGGTVTGQQLTLTGLSAYNGQQVHIVATTFKRLSQASQKIKTLQEDQSIYIASPSTTKGAYDSLGVGDVLRIKAIYMASDFLTQPTVNDKEVTSRYELDNGMRDNFYANARIRLKQSAAAPTGRLLVVCDYFTHGPGDFFTVDSYNGQVNWEDIPYYSSASGSYNLRDVIDFRPRKADNANDFNSVGGSLVAFPSNNSLFVGDLEIYLPRRDKIYLTEAGEFKIVKGISSLKPSYPEDPAATMTLYRLDIAPYTALPTNVVPTLVENKRYTMRDIGKLETRIKNLEYYTTLSLLEKDVMTSSTLANDGTDRFKNGFVVDGFYGHNVGDVYNPDYVVSMDINQGTLRPHYYQDSVNLIIDTNGLGSCTKTGSLVTLPIIGHEKIISQPYASGSENTNPFWVFKYDSNLVLNPESDDWIDVDQRPAVTINNEGIYDAILALADAADVLGTFWNAWQTTWTGAQTAVGRAITTRQDNFSAGSTLVTVSREFVNNAGQQRTGERITIDNEIMKQDLGQRVIDVNWVPFMRSRKVYFYAGRLKPNTRLHMFIDETNVNNYARSTTNTQTYEQWFAEQNGQEVESYKGYTQHPNGANNLITNAEGEIWGSFIIPSNSALTFKTGQRLIRITDDPNNDMGEAYTTAECTFAAQGLIQSVESTVISTKIPTFETTELKQNRVIQQRNTRVIAQFVEAQGDGGGDGGEPLAQTFIVNKPGGAYISKLDAYFKTKSTTNPIVAQLRTVTNGYPTKEILSEALLKPSEVQVSDNASLASTFVFPDLVYLKPGIEYAFVLKGLDIEYRAWVSELGEYDVTDTNYRIVTAPHSGVMFKSENASTWQSDQFKDIKFNLYCAQFDNSIPREVRFTHSSPSKTVLQSDPFITYNGSNKVRVLHKNHGLFEGSSVNLSDLVEAGGYINNIPLAQLSGTKTVTNVEYDSYEITATTNANADGAGGGSTVRATSNKLINILNLNVGEIVLPNTATSYKVKTCTGKVLGSTASAYQMNNDYIDIMPATNILYTYPQCIPSSTNMGSVTGSETELSGKGMYVKAKLSSAVPHLSPVIDVNRFSAITVANRIDNPVASADYVQNLNNVIYNSPNAEVRFVPETAAKDNSGMSRYMIRKVVLAEDATDLKMYIKVNRPSGSYIDVYYRLDEDDTVLFTDQPWVLATPTADPPQSDNPDLYTEIEYDLEDIGTFSGFAIKIVMRSNNPCRVPTIKDFRAIALS